jgi:predicted molibdopterin-dependent oxidoreductase YjgC
MLVCPEAYVELSRGDAAALKIAEGDAVTVKSAAGEIKLTAKVGNRLPAGVVFAPYHFGDAAVNSIAVGEPVTWVTISK